MLCNILTRRRCTCACMMPVLALFMSVEPLAAQTELSNETLQVMTYNVRYASDDPPNAWGVRRPVAVAMLREQSPDIIGTQEGLYRQIKDFESDLPEYDWIGLGREGGSHGEFMAIFYRSARLEPLEFDHFWLSDTPDRVGSTTWGNMNRRMVTWIRFRDRRTERESYCFNTHFDHEIQLAREKSAELLWERIQALKTELPIILLGDFNSAAQDSPAYDLLVGPEKLTDVWLTAKSHGPQVATFHAFEGVKPEGRRIDWILTRGALECESTEIVTYSSSGQFPSDHFPVVGRLRYTTTTP